MFYIESGVPAHIISFGTLVVGGFSCRISLWSIVAYQPDELVFFLMIEGIEDLKAVFFAYGDHMCAPTLNKLCHGTGFNAIDTQLVFCHACSSCSATISTCTIALACSS